jgi:hypothetical protein
MGVGGGEDAVRIITTTRFHPVRVLASDTVAAINDYVAREGTAGRELHVAQLLTSEAINALKAEVKADKNVPITNKNWLDWDTKATLKYLLTKYPTNSTTAKMDLDRLIEKTVIDLTPERRQSLNKLILALVLARDNELEKRGGVVGTIEGDMVNKLI